MKKIIFGVMLAAVSFSAQAQENWQSAIVDLKGGRHAGRLVTNSQEEKDTRTEGMPLVSKLDEFRLKLGEGDAKKLIQRFKDAFEKDRLSPLCYSVTTQDAQSAGAGVRFLIGQTGTRYVDMGGDKKNLMYQCFLVPDDTTRSHRYAYAIEWSRATGEDVDIRVVVCYSKIAEAKKPQEVSGDLPMLQRFEILKRICRKEMYDEQGVNAAMSIYNLTKEKGIWKMTVAERKYMRAEVEDLISRAGNKNVILPYLRMRI